MRTVESSLLQVYKRQCSEINSTLWPAFALVSMNITLYSRDFFSPSSMDTCLVNKSEDEQINLMPCQMVLENLPRLLTHLLSFKSVLLPTNTIITSFPLSARTSSIHFVVFINEFRSFEPPIRILIMTLKSLFAQKAKKCLLVMSYTIMQTDESRI